MTDKFDPHSTTILAVRRDGKLALGGDGQVTLGNTVMKGNARKVRRLCTTARCSQGLPVALPTRSRCSNASRASCSSTAI